MSGSMHHQASHHAPQRARAQELKIDAAHASLEALSCQRSKPRPDQRLAEPPFHARLSLYTSSIMDEDGHKVEG